MLSSLGWIKARKVTRRPLARRWPALLFLLLSSLSLPALANIDLVASGVMLHDPAGELDYRQALSLAYPAQARQQQIQVQPRGRVYWLIADLPATGETADWRVVFYNTLIEKIDTFVLDGDRLVDEHHVGRRLIAGDDVPSMNMGYEIPVTLQAGRKLTLVVRAESSLFYKPLIHAGPAKSAETSLFARRATVTFVFGAMLALMLYNLLLAGSLRDLNYLIYSLHAIAHIGFFLSAFGILESLFGIYDRNLIAFPALLITVQFFGALFCYRFLALPRHMPLLALIYRAFLAVLLLELATLPFIGGPALAQIAPAGHLFLMPLVIVTGIIGTWKKVRQAPYILLGWGLMVLFGAATALDAFGLTQYSSLSGLSVFIAALAEMFVLSLALADRIRQLQHDKTLAEEANAAKSSFLATMSHEIRTPMNGLMGMVELLARSRLSPLQKSYVENLHYAGNALLSLLNDILDYSKAEAGKIVLKPVSFQPRLLAESMTSLMLGRAQEKGLDLEVQVAEGVARTMLGDAARLRQVLLNLLSNAVKFTEQGTVTLQVALLSEQDDQQRLRFSVSDTGIGIPESARPILFERFSQVDSSLSRHYSGSGLGLAIVKQLVEAMGGDVDFVSTPGRGSCFSFTLELAALPDEQSDGTALETASATSGIRILVVDDVEINRKILTDLLGLEGHRVDSATDGHAAFETLLHDAYDLVLLDVFMPDMDGLEVTRRLRQAGVTIPIIGVTANAMPEERASYLAVGMNEVLLKPVEPEILYRLVADYTSAAKDPTPPDPGGHPSSVDTSSRPRSVAG